MKIQYTTDREEIDVEFVAKFLTEESYWAKGRIREAVLSTIRNSFCISMFVDSMQIGFGRVVTDYETFAYIMDVFIARSHRQMDYGKQLMKMLLASPELSNINKFHLKTVEAKHFYGSLGFVDVQKGFMCLEIASAKR